MGTHAEGGLLLLLVVEVVVVGVVVHYAQVHWKDGCGGGGHLHGLHCRAHVHCCREEEEEEDEEARNGVGGERGDVGEEETSTLF